MAPRSQSQFRTSRKVWHGIPKAVHETWMQKPRRSHGKHIPPGSALQCPRAARLLRAVPPPKQPWHRDEPVGDATSTLTTAFHFTNDFSYAFLSLSPRLNNQGSPISYQNAKVSRTLSRPQSLSPRGHPLEKPQISKAVTGTINEWEHNPVKRKIKCRLGMFSIFQWAE